MNHAVHVHGATGFSSVCFIEYDKEDHKSTVFVSPFGNCVTGTLERYSPEVEEGDIIFFPLKSLPYVLICPIFRIFSVSGLVLCYFSANFYHFVYRVSSC